MRRLAFEVISQSETKSVQRPSLFRERRKNNAKYKGHIACSLAQALRLNQNIWLWQQGGASTFTTFKMFYFC
jgi:hypothetical protein